MNPSLAEMIDHVELVKEDAPVLLPLVGLQTYDLSLVTEIYPERDGIVISKVNNGIITKEKHLCPPENINKLHEFIRFRTWRLWYYKCQVDFLALLSGSFVWA